MADSPENTPDSDSPSNAQKDPDEWVTGMRR
jgi:hypothetical protein